MAIQSLARWMNGFGRPPAVDQGAARLARAAARARGAADRGLAQTWPQCLNDEAQKRWPQRTAGDCSIRASKGVDWTSPPMSSMDQLLSRAPGWLPDSRRSSALSSA